MHSNRESRTVSVRSKKKESRAVSARNNSPFREKDFFMAERLTYPLAYHITWGTYGTRLHGDERGTVHRQMNEYGEPIIGEDQDWNFMESHLLRFPPRVLTHEQCLLIQDAIPDICVRGKWELRTCSAAPDHVHTILTARVDGKDIRKWLKRWVGEELSKTEPLLPDQTWWAECGSVKWVWTDDYYQRAYNYVSRQRM